MKLYIIRHGQTDWNVQGRIQGRQDIPLNAAGRSQAEMLAKGMEKRPVTAIYSSPFSILQPSFNNNETYTGFKHVTFKTQ